jgi:hypothetical protein
VAPGLEELGLAEIEHSPRNNRYAPASRGSLANSNVLSSRMSANDLDSHRRLTHFPALRTELTPLS